ncbi:TonB-dependent receptor domain-containing protein [Algiphilus sp.]|uniref:TonB-dependent receptor domain-containing protein n=1 Tax=Algiphilus sp. TaxID=1872431 RepID=UPI003B521E77
MSVKTFFIRLFAVVGCLFSAALYASDAQVSIFVLQEGSAVQGMELSLDGKRLGKTDADGAAFVDIPSGEHLLELTAPGGETPIYSQRIKAEANDFIQLIVTLEPTGQADADIEGGSGAQPVQQEVEGVPGTLTGRIVSAEDDSPIENAQVFVSGSRESARTDADGRFSLQVPEGNYAISIVHPRYTTRTITDISVAPEETVEQMVSLTPSGLELREFVVTAPYIEGSVASVLSEQRESSAVVDVLGAEQMSRSGDSNAADALARVTGLTIEDGKFVVVRGAPSRYTKTLFNGSPLPSPDPIKRIVPLDLFPTGVLSSISVSKSYDASQPGSFGAGLINLETVGIPESPFLNVSVKTGVNSVSTGEDGLDHEGGGTDFLGIDDGTRELPEQLDAALGGNGSGDDLVEGARQLSNIWEVRDFKPPADLGLGLGAGTNTQWLGGTFGAIGSVSWSQKYRTQERIRRTYSLGGDGNLALRDDKTEFRTDMNVDLGGLIGLGLEWDRHALRSNTFVIRKTQQRSEIIEGFDATSDDRFAREFLLDWNERELLLQQFTGEHEFALAKLDWRTMVAESSRDAPDRRDYIYRRREDEEGNFIFFRQNGAARRWDDSEDSVVSLELDLTIPVLQTERTVLNIGTGVSTYAQERESRTQRLELDVAPGDDLNQPPEVLLDPARTGNGLTPTDQTQDNDNYFGDADVNAAYLKFDFDWLDVLRVVGGVRFEQAEFLVETFVAGGSAGGQSVTGSFDTDDVLASLGLTWRIRDDLQLRGNFGQSVSRPVLNELSPARYFDPDSGDEFLGNPELEPTEIDAFDLRLEWYPSNEEVLSVGAFLKDYTNPIEQAFTGVGGSDPLRTNQNAESAEVTGFEFSARTTMTRLLSFVDREWAWTDKVYLQANASLIDSSVTLSAQNLETNVNRTLQGQADQTLNFQFGYQGERQDWTVSLNRVGERLRLTGRQGQPDVFQSPITVVDFKYTITLFEDWKVEASIGNLLNEEVEWLQGGEVFRAYETGIDAGLGLKYNF